MGLSIPYGYADFDTPFDLLLIAGGPQLPDAQPRSEFLKWLQDQARGFQSTPEQYQFGVCAAATADPHCTFDPNKVPKAMDVITPAGVLQSDELDYIKHNPVTLQDVTIP